MSKLPRLLIVFSIILLLLSGCTTKKQDTGQDEPAAPQTKTVTLYFLDNNSKQLVPEERQIKSDKNLYEAIVREIIAGPEGPGILPVISRDAGGDIVESADRYDTNGIMVKFKEGTEQYLDKSPAFIQAMVLSLTQIKDVDKVAVKVNNEPYGDEIYVRTIKTGSVYVSKSRQEYLKGLAEKGKADWLYDPVAVAQKEAGAFGFLPDDEYILSSQKDQGEGSGTGEAYVNVKHEGEQYTVQLFQPYGPGQKSIWVLNSISRKETPIPESDPNAGEAFIYGRVKSVEPEQRLVVIEREYSDSHDTQIEAGPEIYILPDAIIHYQEKVGISASGYEYNEYDVDLKDIKPDDELGIIITKDKKARAIIISGRK